MHDYGMRELILIRGPSSVGKTSVGSELAKRLGFEFIDEDDVRHEFDGDCHSPKAFAFTAKRLKQLTRTGKFVVAGCFTDASGVKALAPDRVIMLTARLPTLFSRNNGMPPGMRMAEERIRYLHESMEPYEGEIVVSTEDKTATQTVEEIYKLQQ